jgi:hypothetical protein
MSSIADFVSSLRDHNARALDLLQLKRFRGKVGRGLAVQLSRPRENPTQVKCRAAPVLAGYIGIDESLAEPGDNGQIQTKVCSQTKGVQSVDVISEERILGKKFSCEGCRRPSQGSGTMLVAKTWPLH